jgi:hypothetical protein
MNRIFYHVRKPKNYVICEHCQMSTPTMAGRNPPIFTLGFEYKPDLHNLYITWAKPHNGEVYIKSFGVQAINNRLDKIIQLYPHISYEQKMPRIVRENLNYYIDRAKRYFKEIVDSKDINYVI